MATGTGMRMRMRMRMEADPSGSGPGFHDRTWTDGAMRLRFATESERDRFDSFVGRHPYGDYLQGWAWGDLKSAAGWEAHRLVMERLSGGPHPETPENGWIAVATVLAHPLPFGLGEILYAPRGPVLDFGDVEVLRSFLTGVRSLFQGRGSVFLKMDPDVPDQAAARAGLRAAGTIAGRRRGRFEGIQPRHVMRLSLDRPLDGVFAAFTSKCRYNIRLAQRKGVSAREATRADLPVFYALLTETAQRDGFGIRAAAYYEHLYDHTVGCGLGRILLAYVGDEPVAGTWTVMLGHKAWYLLGASSNRHRNRMPNYLLQWEAIQWAHARGARLYDFLGVPKEPDPRNPISGLYRFKSGFGAERESFIGEFDLPLRPAMYVLWRIADPVQAKCTVWAGALRRVLRERPPAVRPDPAPQPDGAGGVPNPDPETAPQP